MDGAEITIPVSQPDRGASFRQNPVVRYYSLRVRIRCGWLRSRPSRVERLSMLCGVLATRDPTARRRVPWSCHARTPRANAGRGKSDLADAEVDDHVRAAALKGPRLGLPFGPAGTGPLPTTSNSEAGTRLQCSDARTPETPITTTRPR